MASKTAKERYEQIILILNEEINGLSCLEFSKKMRINPSTIRIYLHKLSKVGKLETYVKRVNHVNMGCVKKIKTTYWRLKCQ